MSLARLAAFAGAIAVAALAHSAQAATMRPFTAAAFAEAQQKNLPVLVEAHADWCPICRAQAPTVTSMASDPAFANLVILRIDYDQQTAEKRMLNIQKQSTLIAFRGKHETGRSVGVTDPDAIRALARGALR
jgi:thiol-disulfide isomerase/thioredoxin